MFTIFLVASKAIQEKKITFKKKLSLQACLIFLFMLIWTKMSNKSEHIQL